MTLFEFMTCYDGGEPVAVQQLSYNAIGQLSGNDLGSFSEVYTYNVRGAMTGRKSDVFEQTISFSNHFDRLYNGSIGMITDKLTGGKSTTSGYSYDNAGRLTSAMIFLDGITRPTGYTYDLNGNITALNRLGYNPPSLAERIDDLVYQYDGNQVRKITDKSPVVISEKTMNFIDGADEEIEYTYDRNGNMTSDSNRGIAMFWDYNNRLEKVNFGFDKYLSFTRSATGCKLSMTNRTPVQKPSIGLGRPWVATTTVMHYYGAYEYRGGKFSRLNTATGYRDSLGVHVFVRDWQGNIRAVVRKGADGKTILEQATYYYPYGMPMAESTNPTINKYKYTGKELLTDHGVNIMDYGPRPYDPTTGIWWSVDEHSADYALTSHYSMCGADPINHIDPDGKDWIYHDEFGYKWDKDVTKDSELEEGWQYVGKENNSILNHLGLSSDSYRVEKEVMGAGGGNNDNGTITYNNLLISLHLNIKFTPLVYMNNNQRQFQGVEMNFMENQIAVTNSDITINPATEIKFEFNKTRFLYPQPYRESVVYTKGSTPRIGRFVFEAQSLKYSSLPDEIIYTTGWNYSTPDGHGAIGLIGAFNAISFRRTIKIRLK